MPLFYCRHYKCQINQQKAKRYCFNQKNMMKEFTKKEWKRVQVLMDKNLFKQLRDYAYRIESSYCEIARKAIVKFLGENSEPIVRNENYCAETTAIIRENGKLKMIPRKGDFINN